jgi:peptidoglycan/xylan/chitin deacetylase (PgdA/CDA1 family)
MRRVHRRRRLVALLALAGLVVVLFAGIGALGGGDGGRDARLASEEVAPAETTPLASTEVPLEPHPGPVPVLMYHVIAAPPLAAAQPELFVTADDFKAQTEWLAERGYVGVTLAQVFAAWEGEGGLPEKPIVISLDDGYASHYTAALPILARLGWPAVLNLKVDALDQGELGEEQVEEMMAAGWEIGAHTVTHPDLTTLSGAELDAEVSGSKRALERRLGTEIDFFCYPSGRYDEETIAAVEDAGFVGATTTESGLASRDRPYELARIRVNGSEGVDGFAAHMRAEGVS